MRYLYYLVKNLIWALKEHNKLYKIQRTKEKFKKVDQNMRVHMYKQWPPSPLEFGIMYKDGKLYDYMNKEFIE